MNILNRFLSGSLTWTVGVLAVALAAILLAGGFFEMIGAGILAKGATLIAGLVFAMLAMRLVTIINGLSGPNDPGLEIIKSCPRALARLRGSYVLGVLILAGLVMGFAPTPHAWPGGQRGDERMEVAEPVQAVLPVRFAACAPYAEMAADAVELYWGEFRYPDAWLAQLYQESLCDPMAVSPVGAAGLAQFMPRTWSETRQRLGLGLSVTPHDDIAVEAGAYYMARQMAVWSGRPRPVIERWRLALASYNAGAGNIIRAQTVCSGARDWRDIETCLPDVTGHHARETRTYVVRIERWWGELVEGDPRRAPSEIRGG